MLLCCLFILQTRVIGDQSLHSAMPWLNDQSTPKSLKAEHKSTDNPHETGRDLEDHQFQFNRAAAPSIRKISTAARKRSAIVSAGLLISASVEVTG